MISSRLQMDEQITHNEFEPPNERSQAVLSPKFGYFRLFNTFSRYMHLVSNLLKSRSSFACTTAIIEHTDTSAKSSDWQTSYQALLENVLEILNSDGSATLHAESNLVEAGFDSLRILQLQTKLKELGPPGFSFSDGKVLNFTTPTALANYILDAQQTYGSALTESSAEQRGETSNHYRAHGVDQQSIASRIHLISVCLSIFLIPLIILATLHFRKTS